MQRVILNVNTAADAELLVQLAKSLSFVSSATVEKAEPATDAPLTAEDWVRPGRPATDAELRQLVEDMENDTGEFTLDEVVNDLLDKRTSDPNSPLTEEDWGFSGRPATEGEVANMVAECEEEYRSGAGYTAGEVMAEILTDIDEWKKKQASRP